MPNATVGIFSCLQKHVLKEDREHSLPWFPQEAWAGSEDSALDREHRYEKDSVGSR